ncbi:MAG: hypothetical protein KJ697_01605 [Nanoarchaeota archaeon]|nr:hypothetical protein [Nanoarchaeota archaeon]
MSGDREHTSIYTYNNICSIMTSGHKSSGKQIRLNIEKIYHWPTLKTVLMVEEAIQNADDPISIEGLKRKLKTKVMDQTLRVVLAYLENKGDILIGEKGIMWIRNDSPEFLKMIKNARMIEV